MDKQDYWDKVTEDTEIEWLRKRNLLSVRLSNILVRGAIYKGFGETEYKPITTVKELLEIDECDLKSYRNMGEKTLEEVRYFKQAYIARTENCQRIRNAPIITEQGQVDWLDGYKVGFRDGVIAVQTQVKEKIDEIANELIDKGEKYGN